MLHFNIFLGSYGFVYIAIKKNLNTHDHKEYAIKVIPINPSEDMDEVCKEITSLQQLSCPFVVSFVESYLHERKRIHSSHKFYF